MPNKREHDKYCKSKGISPKVCEETNIHMDRPAKEVVGCLHREERHSLLDCTTWALRSPKEAKERFRACQAHRELDRQTDRCDSESLKE